MSLSWKDALKQFNDERKAKGEGKYIIPTVGTPEHDKVRGYMTSAQTSGYNNPLKQHL